VWSVWEWSVQIRPALGGERIVPEMRLELA
jgi:hypothetical protein